jgi:hypothetical protein
MIAAFDDGVVIQGAYNNLMCLDSERWQGVRHVARMHDLKYRHPDTNTFVEYTEEVALAFDVVPYVPSLVPV